MSGRVNEKTDRVCERTSALLASLGPGERAMLIEMLRDDRTFLAGDLDELFAILNDMLD